MWSTSSLVPWNALLAVTDASTSHTGCMPRSRTASADSITMAAAPIPRSIPWRRLSNGTAASSTASSVAAAPVARKPAPTHSRSASEVTLSAATITTRRQRPARIQSSARPMAWVVLAQAALTCVFGPRAPMISANCEWPIARTRNRKRRSNSNGSAAIAASSSPIRRSVSAAASPPSRWERMARNAASSSRRKRSAR